MSTLLNTRIRLRYDTYANWSTINPVLLEGEVAIAVPGTNLGSVTEVASCLMKVGNGTAHFNELPWLSALAADVHTWAKKSEADFKDWLVSAEGPALATKSEVAALTSRVTAVEGKVTTAEGKITTLEGKVTAAEGDIDTLQADLDAAEKKIADLETSLGEDGDIGARVAALETADEEQDSKIATNTSNIATNTGAIATLNGDASTVGSVKNAVKAEETRAMGVEGGLQDAIDVINGEGEGSIKKAIADEVTNRNNAIESVRATLQDNIDTVSGVANAADALSKTNKSAIDILNGSADTEGSVRHTAADVVNTLIGGADSADTITNVKTLIDYVNENGGELSELTTTVQTQGESISAQADQITTLQQKDTTLEGSIKGINDKIGSAALGTTDQTLIGAINELKQSITDGDAATLAGAKTYVDDKVEEVNSANSSLLSRIEANEAKLDGITTKVTDAIETAKNEAATDAQNKADAAKTAAIAAAATDAQTKADKALTDAKAYTDSEISEVESTITALQDFDKTALTGVVTSADGVDTLAMSLNGAALDLVFACGGASV